MVHLRLNDPDTSRNELINYITALPQYPDHEEARRRLCQLAAQVKPVMKVHGFQINSLEEFEWNREFAGRNWNAGENIELVLRRQDGSFAPLQWVLVVFCHELAHIKHMNHVPSLHGKLDRELKQECRELQSRGYYGDGFWSAGQKLFDNVFVAGAGMNQLKGLPQYSCGGAYRRQTKRKRTCTSGTKRKRRGFQGPSLHTGAQTAANTKGGRRIQRDLPGQGSRVDSLNFIPKASASSKSYRDDPNSTFRKRATTQQARELRAEAAMKRLGLGKFKVEEQAKEVDEKKPTKATTKQDPSSSRQTLDGFLSIPPTTTNFKPESGSKEAKDDSETETEEEEAETDPNDGYIILDGPTAVDDDDDVETETEPEDDASGAGRASRPSDKASGKVKIKEAETQASGETEAQRRERARLYRQHERAQGGGASGKTKTTNEEWSEWLSVAPGQPSNIAVPSATTIAIASSPAAQGSATKASNRPPPLAAAKQTKSTKEPIRVKAEEAIAILDSDDDDRPATSTSIRRAPSSSTQPAPSAPLPPSTPTLSPRPFIMPDETHWQCHLCTLLNSPSPRCEACDTSRGSTLLGL